MSDNRIKENSCWIFSSTFTRKTQ